VAGARIRAPGHAAVQTGAGGRTEFAIASPAPWLEARAFGHRPTRVLWPAHAPQQLRIVLQPANELRIVVTAGPGRSPAGGLYLGVVAPRDEAWALWHLDEEWQGEAEGLASVERSWRFHPAEWTVGGELAGPSCAIGNIPAELPLEVRLETVYGDVIDRQHLRMGSAAHREVRFALPAPRAIEGRVVDSRGVPIPGARIGRRRYDRACVVADGDGRFRLGDVFAARPQLVIQGPGLATRTFHGPDLFTQHSFVLLPE
jgi:hypothetical protein